MVMKKGNDQKQNAEKRKNRMTALLMALILCVGMVSGTNKAVRAQSASLHQNALRYTRLTLMNVASGCFSR